MRLLELDPRADAYGRGRQHGLAFAGEIHEIAAIRLRLVEELGGLGPAPNVLRAAQQHLPVLEAYDPDLYAELIGLADGAEIDRARVVVLNHYTDLRDLNPDHVSLHFAEEDCSVVFARQPEGNLLGQTWDMHGTAADYILMLRVPATERAPEAYVLTITGCLGLAGMNASGVGVTINNLISTDARIGVVWPALVRRMLADRSARAALRTLLDTQVGSGHHYMVADARDAFAVETSGVLRELTFSNEGDRYHHTNHCVNAAVASVSRTGESSTTQERYDALTRFFAGPELPRMDELWRVLGSHEGHPRGICTHMATAEKPNAMRTCAGLLMDLGRKELWAKQGCLHEAEPERFTLA